VNIQHLLSGKDIIVIHLYNYFYFVGILRRESEW